MFNALLLIPNLFYLSIFSCFTISLTRHIFFKRKLYIILFHACLFFGLFIAAIGGGSVQSDAYSRLDQFVALEKNSQLEHAKNNPQHYDSMLQIDLKQFKSSNEFKVYLQDNDASVDNAEAIFIGWIFSFMVEIAMGLAFFLRKRKNCS